MRQWAPRVRETTDRERAILDAITLFSGTTAAIAARLGIRYNAAQRQLLSLYYRGLVKRTNNQWRRV